MSGIPFGTFCEPLLFVTEAPHDSAFIPPPTPLHTRALMLRREICQGGVWSVLIYPETPLRLSDDTKRWGKEWRALKKERGNRLWERVEKDTGRQRSGFKGLKWADVLEQAY
jgi:hypothetical protein